MCNTPEQQLGEEPVSLGHIGLDIRAKGQYARFCIFCVSGCCTGWNCADWKSCCRCRGERWDMPFSSFNKVLLGYPAGQKLLCPQMIFCFHCQLLTCYFSATWGGQSKTTRASPHLGYITPDPYLPSPIRLWSQRQLLCHTLAPNLLWNLDLASPPTLFACTCQRTGGQADFWL